MNENESGGSFVLGFLIGAMVGAAAALLLSPQSGEELRQTIEQKGVALKDEAARAAEDAKLQAQRLAEQTRGQVEVVGEKGRIVISENVRKAQQAVGSTTEKPAGEQPAVDPLA